MQFYPNFALFSRLGGMNLDHDFVQMSKLSEDQKNKVVTNNEHFFPQIEMKTKKKGLYQKWNTFFPDFKWTPTLRCTPKSNYWGRCRSRPYSNYWVGYSQIVEGYIPPPSPSGFGISGFRPAPFMNLGCNEEKLTVVDYIEMKLDCYYDVRCCKNYLKLYKVYAKI